MFVGYSTDHPSNTWRFYDPISKGYHISQDVIWLHRMYFPKLSAGEGGDNDDAEITDDVPADEEIDNEPNNEVMTTEHGQEEVAAAEEEDDDDDEEDTVNEPDRVTRSG
jgi:hypothetical protein